MNTLTALTLSLVLTATVCASYVRSKVPAPSFAESEARAAGKVEAPPPAPPLPRSESGR